jgi:hypothetical protein
MIEKFVSGGIWKSFDILLYLAAECFMKFNYLARNWDNKSFWTEYKSLVLLLSLLLLLIQIFQCEHRLQLLFIN